MDPVAAAHASTIADRLAAARHRRFVGRATELELFAQALRQQASPDALFYVYAPGGTGKTMLLGEFARVAQNVGAHVVALDARNMQVSTSGVTAALAAAGVMSGQGFPTDTRRRLVLLIDTCELISLLESWIRDDLLPRLPSDSVVVLASRNPPDPAWLERPGWGDLTRVIPLRNLHPDESRQFLDQRSIPLRWHEDILSFTHGHPLALSLVAESTRDGVRPLNPIDEPNIVQTLMRHIHRVEPSPEHRRTLELACRARVTTESLLADTFGVERAHALFQWLASLSFMDSDGEGIFPHDLVREVVEADLRWRHPQEYEEIHRLVHDHVVRRIRATQGLEQLRHLHSLMFLHRTNPVWQPYFGTDEYGHNYTEPAAPADLPAILEIVTRHEGEAAARIAAYWFKRKPGAFHLVRGLQGQTTGIIATIILHSITEADMAADPAARLVANHVNATAPLAPGQAIGIMRFAMGNQTYRNPSTPMIISVHGAGAAYGNADLAVSTMVVSEPDYWRDFFAYVRHLPLPGGTFRTGKREFTIFAHDWRTEPIERFDEILTRQEIATSMIHAAPMASDDPVVALSKTEFAESVRRALRTGLVPSRLHDNPLLRSHLVRHRHTGNAAPEYLCDQIREAASTLQANARTERAFRALDRTYLDPALTQEQAAEDLDLPFSTYRRHLTTAIDLLTDELWHRELRASASLAPE